MSADPDDLWSTSAEGAYPQRLRGRKKYGQHFLRDRGIITRIVKAIAPSPDEKIVEVGAGPGVLTELLAQQSGRVVAIEVDERLCAGLRGLSKRYGSIRVVCRDVLSLSVEEILAVGEIDAKYIMVGNLPYYIASAVVRHFLEAAQPPERIVVMVQREVAENMASSPGDMSLLGASVQIYARPRILFSVPPQAFSPPPKVWSAVAELDVYPQALIPPNDREGFFELLRAGFRARRKQLHNSLAIGLGLDPESSAKLLSIAGIDPSRRAQTLSVEEWLALYRAWRSQQETTHASKFSG